jgi:hypothetical protein
VKKVPAFMFSFLILFLSNNAMSAEYNIKDMTDFLNKEFNQYEVARIGIQEENTDISFIEDPYRTDNEEMLQGFQYLADKGWLTVAKEGLSIYNTKFITYNFTEKLKGMLDKHANIQWSDIKVNEIIEVTPSEAPEKMVYLVKFSYKVEILPILADAPTGVFKILRNNIGASYDEDPGPDSIIKHQTPMTLIASFSYDKAKLVLNWPLIFSTAE